MVEAVVDPVDDGPVGEQRGEAEPAGLDDLVEAGEAIALCQADPKARVLATDLADAMLALARRMPPTASPARRG